MSTSDEEEDHRRRPGDGDGDDGSGGGGGGVRRERSATYAGSKCLDLLGLLRSAKHAGRIKALRRFQEYVQQFRPEFYDDDVELLLVGSASLDGLVPWCGYTSSHGRGEEALKTTSRAVLQLLHWLVAIYKEEDDAAGGGGGGSGSNVFLDKFLELPPALLKRMNLGLHVRAATADGEGATEGAFELLSLALTRHNGPDPDEDAADGDGEEEGEGATGQPLGLDVLLPEPEAQAQFTRWLQQSASEQQLIDRVEKQRAALASAASANQAQVPPGFGPLGGAADGGAVGGGGGGAGGAAPCLDPLGLNNNLDLASAEQLRPKSAMPGAQGRGGKGGPLLGAKDRMFLLQRLQQAALGGGGSSAQGQGAGAGAGAGAAKGSGGGKYTRNKARALKSASAGSTAGAAGTSGGGGGGGMAASASIVPQDEAFDPVLFLTIIHGGSSFDDLRRGQENLEKGLGTQAGQLQRLVLEHYDAFGRCAEGIQWFRHMVEEEFFREAAAKGSGNGHGHGRGDGAKIAHLLEIVAGTQAGAKELFRPLLERMDRAKGLRSARLLLQRLARVLDVPGRMAQLEALGKYEEVVREYERVRALPSGAGAGLLGRVQLQAEAVADKLRARLRAFVGADAHPVEDLVQAADLLVRLGPGKGLGQGGGGQGQEEDEPLLFTFARQAELLGKGLDALEAWYAKELQAVKEQEQREGVRRQLLLQQQATKQQASAPLIASASGAPAARVGWKQRSFHSLGDGDAMDEEEGDDEEGHGGSSAAGGAPMPGRSHSHGTGDGEEEEDGENDEDSLEDDSLAAAALRTGPGSNDDDDDLLLGSPMGDNSSVANHRRGGLDFSTGFGLDSVEHRASALRLQYTRRLVRLGLRSLPTLLRLAALVADDLADVRVTWEPGHFTFHVTNASAGGRDRSGSRLVTGGGGGLGLGLGLGGQEVTAASAALDQVGLALQRISTAARRAMFGESGARTQLPRSPKQQAAAANAAAESVRHRPLDPVYFREALRAVAELYFEGVFASQEEKASAASGASITGLADTTSGLAQAGLPPLRSLVEDAQRRQAQSVLDRLGEEAARLAQREDWARCPGWWLLSMEEGGGAAGVLSTKALRSPPPGTNLPRAFLETATVALEDLAATLPRPFMCAEQAALSLDRALTRLLTAMAALAAPDEGPAASPAPRPLRLLALVGNCIQLHAAVLPLLAATAQRLFKAEKPSLAGAGPLGRVLALHDDCLRLYLDGKAAAFDAALGDGWVVKAKALRGALLSPIVPAPTGAGAATWADASGAAPAAAIQPPGYLSRLLLLLVQAKAEVQELLGERPLLTDDDEGDDEEEEEEDGELGAGGRLFYVDAVMRKLAQAALQGLTTRAGGLAQSLGQAMPKQGARSRRRLGALAHCAHVEATFLLQGPLKAFSPPERVEAARKGLEPLKALAIDGLVGGDGEEEEEAAAMMEYTAESVGKALRVYVASL